LEIDHEDELLRSVALQNAGSILAARKRAEQDLVAAKEELRRSEERLRATFEQAAVGISISELDGGLTEVNRKFAEILGYSADELTRMTSFELTHPDDLPQTRANVARLVSGESSSYVLEKRYLRKDGGVVWSRTTVAALRDSAGQPRQIIGVIEDITQRKLSEEALQEAAEERKRLLQAERAARAEAERMSELKDEFLATLSHELRTPLGAILGWSQVVRSRKMSEDELRRALEVIERNARAQARLIEDLLDMARITSGKVRLDVQPVEPASFIDAALETVKPAVEAKGIRLQKLIDPKAGPISGDPGRLQQVVWNLLSNAIKFTPKDGKVEVLLERVNSHIELSVADTGIGIRPEFLDHVFDRFRQADASSTRRYSGLGLGLAIAKHLVELHGGTLQAKSAGEGSGSTFTVHLPLTAVHRPAAGEERAHPSSPKATAPAFKALDLSGLTVLAVDDELDARELIKRVLEDCGARVITAGTAAEALLLAEQERPHMLLSDIGMPAEDGFELLKRLRALGRDRGGDIPAVALTAFARSEDRTRALRAGFRMHVSKPVEPSELIATVANIAGRSAN